jgi:hypothetical protein
MLSQLKEPERRIFILDLEKDRQTNFETELQRGEDLVGAKEHYHYHDLLLSRADCPSRPPTAY